MTKKTSSTYFVHDNGDVSFYMHFYPLENNPRKVEQVVIKDGLITTDIVDVPCTGAVFTVDSKLVPSFFESISKLPFNK